MTELRIRKSIDVAAPVETLWKILTDSEFIRQYMFGCNAETDWKPGSTLLWRGAADGVVYVKGHVVRFEPARALEYTIFDPNSKLADIPSNYLTMNYDLREDSPGRSILEITQGDFSKVEDGREPIQAFTRRRRYGTARNQEASGSSGSPRVNLR